MTNFVGMTQEGSNYILMAIRINCVGGSTNVGRQRFQICDRF